MVSFKEQRDAMLQPLKGKVTPEGRWTIGRKSGETGPALGCVVETELIASAGALRVGTRGGVPGQCQGFDLKHLVDILAIF